MFSMKSAATPMYPRNATPKPSSAVQDPVRSTSAPNLPRVRTMGGEHKANGKSNSAWEDAVSGWWSL
ncbi:MAG: hypothetical protein RIR25_718 [Verrucomicrobiota bacterium]